MCLLGCFCFVDRAEIASLAAERVCLPLEVKYGEVLILETKENKLIMDFENPPPCPPYLLLNFGLMTFGGKVTSRTGVDGVLFPASHGGKQEVSNHLEEVIKLLLFVECRLRLHKI